MSQPWLGQYPDGAPAEIDLAAHASLKDVLQTCCARYAERPAYSSMGVVMSFREIDEASRAFGAWLQKGAGLQRGERVALMMPNLLQYPVALFGALRAGMVVVNVNPMYTPRELEHQLKDAGVTVVVVLENCAHTLQQVIASTAVRKVVTTQVGDLLPPLQRLLTNAVVKHVKKMVPPWQLPGAVSFRAVLAAGRAMALDDVALTHTDLAFLQYTGGTTGTAKGAMLSHGNMVANVLCADIDGFRLHAAVRCGADDRQALEQLCRYITRPALANERVQTNAAGRVVLKLKTPWRDGTTHLVMSPLEFMQRLAALVPSPRLHLIRFHGVLSPNAKLRAQVVPQEIERPTQATAPVECEAICAHHLNRTGFRGGQLA